MKKYFLIFLAVMMMFVGICKAEDGSEEAEKSVGVDKKISTYILLHTNWIKPEKGKSFSGSEIMIYFNYDNWLGLGVDETVVPDQDFSESKAFITLNRGPFYVLAGMSTNNLGQDYVKYGAWYLQTVKNFNILACVENYSHVSSKALDYVDTYLEVMHPLGKSFSVGADISYDYWWRGPSHDWFLVGPVIKYGVNKNLSVFVRPSVEWDKSSGASRTKTEKLRVGLEINF